MNSKALMFASVLFIALYVGSTSQKGSFSSKKIGIALIDGYKEHIASLHFTQCGYHPTCSQYTKQSIEKYGLLKGWIMGCDRLMRCNHDLWVYPEVKVNGELKKFDPVL